MRAKKILGAAAAAAAILSSVQPVEAGFNYTVIATPIQNAICGIYGVFVYLASTLAALVFIAAATQWVASRDDPAKRKQAQTIMIHALIGLMLVGLANQLIKEIGSVAGCSKEGAVES